MIRGLQKADINRVADIWLNTNLKAHYFISEQYWFVPKEMQSQGIGRCPLEIQREGLDEATGEKEYIKTPFVYQRNGAAGRLCC